MVAVEAAAVFCGLLCVYWTIRQDIRCWPAGLVQVLLFIVIFYRVRLYSDVLLHLIYVGLQVYGWYHWRHGAAGVAPLRVTRLSGIGRVGWGLVAVGGALCWGFFMARATDAAVPYADAFTTVASLVAQWLMARKILESWGFWLAVDVVSVGIYLYKGLMLTAGLYAVFFGMATAGWIAWRRSLAGASGAEAVRAHSPA